MTGMATNQQMMTSAHATDPSAHATDPSAVRHIYVYLFLKINVYIMTAEEFKFIIILLKPYFKETNCFV